MHLASECNEVIQIYSNSSNLMSDDVIQLQTPHRKSFDCNEKNQSQAKIKGIGLHHREVQEIKWGNMMEEKNP